MSKSKKIGNKGEMKVASVLSCLPSSNFRLYNNVMLKTGRGTTQIDHLLISDRGIFVIETKAHKGVVFGNANLKYWTQCLYGKGGVIRKYKYYSPYWQNRSHLKSVMQHLRTNWVCGIICFTSDNVNLSSVNCESVTKIENLYNLICSIYNGLSFADYNFYDMCQRLERENIQSAYYDRKHVSYVKSLSSNRGGG